MSAIVAASDVAAIAAAAHVQAREVVAGAAASAPVQRLDEPPLVETFSADELKNTIAASIEAMGGLQDLVPDAVDMPADELRGVLEAVLLVATKPLKVERLVKLIPGSDARYLAGFLQGLAHRFDHERRGWELRSIADGWQLLTRRSFHPWVRQLDKRELPSHLTKSAIETLAIVAYKQPVTRGAIEDIRGVQSGPMLRQLMDLKLVQVVGRDEDALGNPLLYGTTDAFCDRFGVGSPADLPRAHELG
ncbi:MAG: SMC-Scp complex subunit ScpB [Planctomycetota bacterium]|jgi:segregation and condensation protein B|nr:SMC-Scp complex subunit ScpB [Planctomycetota bacterium]